MLASDIKRRLERLLPKKLETDFQYRKYWYEDDVKLHTFNHLESIFQEKGFIAHSEVRGWPGYTKLDGSKQKKSTPDLVLYRTDGTPCVIVEIKCAVLDKTNVRPRNVKEDVNKMIQYIERHSTSIGLVIYVALQQDMGWTKVHKLKGELESMVNDHGLSERIIIIDVVKTHGCKNYQQRIEMDVAKFKG